MKFWRTSSDVGSVRPDHVTPVRNPYFPVMIEARVGAQEGFTHRFVNVNPRLAMSFRFGVVALTDPSGNPFVASLPMSSARMNRMFSPAATGGTTSTRPGMSSV